MERVRIMKNTKRILALLLAAIFVISLSACEITREGNQETTADDRTYEYVADEELEGDDISDKIYSDDTEYQLWYADNGDIYAFNSAGQFYLKSGEDVYYGSYKYTTSTSTIYSGLLSIMCDNDSSKDETFNVKTENDDLLLTRASNPDDTIRITKAEGSQDVTDSEAVTEDVVGETPAEDETMAESEPVEETSAETEAETEGSVSDSANPDVYEIMGLKIYYLTLIELVEGDVSEIRVSAAPAVSVQAEDGTVKYEYDSENAVQITISENSNIYMPNASEPSYETYGCDIYQMRDCLEAMGGFYATVIGEIDNVESVKYHHVAQ